MHPRLLSLLLLGLLTACGTEPGKTLRFGESALFRFEKTSRTGREILSPFALRIEPGRAFIIYIANPGKVPVSLHVSGAEPTARLLEPGRWKRIEGATTAGAIELTWSGGPLVLAEPYLMARGRGKEPNILLLSIDTLRQDFFDPSTMPKTHALFTRGVIFDRIYSSAPWTLPAHASLLAGQYPVRHGVRRPDQKLAEAAITLGEVLQDHGYRTWAITEGNYLSAPFGLAQGFHGYYEDSPQMMAREVSAVSKLEQNLEALSATVAEPGKEPRFIFFHTYEVHCPYVPRGGLRDEEGMGTTGWLLEHDGKPLGEGVADKLRALYTGEVAYTDEMLAPLIESLLDEGDWLVALVSDHGEEFGEHGGLLHADTLYEEAMRIPFALAGWGVPETQTVAGRGSIVDVPVTLLALLGIEPPDQWQGRDLLRANHREQPVYAESFFFGPHIPVEDPRISGVWAGSDKLVQVRNFAETRAELFDLADDPGELRDVSADAVPKRDALFLLLDTYLRDKGLSGEAVGELTPEQLEAMRALGYLQ